MYLIAKEYSGDLVAIAIDQISAIQERRVDDEPPYCLINVPGDFYRLDGSLEYVLAHIHDIKIAARRTP